MEQISPEWIEDLRTCPIGSWSGRAWRFHNRRYAATSHGGSLTVTGRYHRGRDHYPEEATWPALYLALGPHIALGERVRHTSPELLASLNEQRLSELQTVLYRVLLGCQLPDCVKLNVAGLAEDVLCAPDYARTHGLAAAARFLGAEGLLVPSCTRFGGGSLVRFPDLLDARSTLVVISSEDPTLFVR